MTYTVLCYFEDREKLVPRAGVRLQKYVERAISEEHAGFRPGRSTIDQLFTMGQIMEKYIEANRPCYINFIDYKQAFDSVWREGLWQTLRHIGIEKNLSK